MGVHRLYPDLSRLEDEFQAKVRQVVTRLEAEGFLPSEKRAILQKRVARTLGDLSRQIKEVMPAALKKDPRNATCIISWQIEGGSCFWKDKSYGFSFQDAVKIAATRGGEFAHDANEAVAVFLLKEVRNKTAPLPGLEYIQEKDRGITRLQYVVLLD